MGTSKRDFVAFGLAALISGFLAASPAAADESPSVNMDADRIAIQGYDPVAYFTAGKPVKGLSDYTYDWQGAKWLFSSPEHKELFSRNPDSYAPRFGGFCAWAMDNGVKVKANPANWMIVDGRLYLSFGPIDEVGRQEALDGKFTNAYENWAKLAQ